MARRGFFVIADISGYSQLMAGSELDQSHAVLRGLLEILLEHARPPLVVSRLLGDAVFAYAPDGSFLHNGTLLEMVEEMYLAFRQALEREARSTSCGCGACAIRPSLDLKVIVHHGEFVVERIGNVQELHGPDVVVAHRLLKNRIAAATGVRAYAFLTSAAVRALGVDPVAGRMPFHEESYEHVGQVSGYVHDLAAVWQREREKRRVWVGPDEPVWFTQEVELPVPLTVAWDYLHAPSKRQWLEAGEPHTRPRPGQGSAGDRCVARRDAHSHVYVDWRPFEYATAEHALPLGTLVRVTLALSPSQTGTRLVVRASQPTATGRWTRLVGRSLAAPRRRGLERAWGARLERLRGALHGAQKAS